MSEQLSRDLASLRIDRSADAAPPRPWPGRLLLLGVVLGLALVAWIVVVPVKEVAHLRRVLLAPLAARTDFATALSVAARGVARGGRLV